MFLSERQYKIISFLKSNTNYSIKQLSEEVLISLPTLRSDINKINNILNKENISIDLYEKEIVLNYDFTYAQFTNIINTYRTIPDDKIIEVYLLSLDTYVSLSSLEEIFFIGKKKIISIIELLEEKYQISKIQNKGIFIEIDLIERQKNIVNLLEDYFFSYNDLEKVKILFAKQLGFLKIQEESILFSYSIIKSYQKSSNLSDNSMCKILITLIIFYNYLNYPPVIDDIELDPKIIIFIKDLISIIPKNQSVYLFEYIYNNLTYKEKKVVVNNEKLYRSLKTDIIFILKKFNLENLDIITIEELTSLCFELDSKKIPSRGNFSIKHNLIEMQLNFPYSLLITNEIIGLLQDKYQIKIYEKDFFYISLLVQTIINISSYSKKTKNVIIITQHSSIVDNFIRSQILKRFSGLNIMKITSLYEYSDQIKEYDNIDFLITTIDYLEAKIPVVNVSLLIKESDLLKIEHKINEIDVSSIINDFLEVENIMLDLNLVDKNDVFDTISEICMNNEYTNKDFLNTLKIRDIENNVIKNGVVFPHGNPKHVLKNKIILIKPKKEIIWEDNTKVKFIVVAVGTLEFISLYNFFIQKIYSIFSDYDFIEQIKLINDPNLLEIKIKNKLRGEK